MTQEYLVDRLPNWKLRNGGRRPLLVGILMVSSSPPCQSYAAAETVNPFADYSTIASLSLRRSGLSRRQNRLFKVDSGS